MDPISATLGVVSGLAGVFGGASSRNAAYVAKANATREKNNQLVRNYNRSLMTIAVQNYGKLTKRNNDLLDYDIAVDNTFSAAARAFAKNEKNVQAQIDQYKLADQKAFVDLSGGLKANEGGRSSAANINRIREAGRQAGMRAGMRSRLLTDQYAANQELAREVNERLARAHDKVYKRVQYNTLMPDKPTMLEGPAAPSQWETIAGLAGVAAQGYKDFSSLKAPKALETPGEEA
jgi:hypothetical protein